jgi:hypothetical protein
MCLTLKFIVFLQYRNTCKLKQIMHFLCVGEYATARAASAAGTIMVWFQPYLLILCSSKKKYNWPRFGRKYLYFYIYFVTEGVFNIWDIHFDNFVTDTILMGYFQHWGDCFNRTWHSLPPTLCEYILFISSLLYYIFYDVCGCHLSPPQNISKQLSLNQESAFDVWYNLCYIQTITNLII